jgi:hypothetical protein
VNPVEPNFPIFDICVSVNESCVPCAKGFDLCALQNKASLEHVFNVVVVARLAVLRN